MKYDAVDFTCLAMRIFSEGVLDRWQSCSPQTSTMIWTPEEHLEGPCKALSLAGTFYADTV